MRLPSRIWRWRWGYLHLLCARMRMYDEWRLGATVCCYSGGRVLAATVHLLRVTVTLEAGRTT